MLAVPGRLAAGIPMGTAAGIGDFIANLTASGLGMKRPNQSGMFESVSRNVLDPAFETIESMNPMGAIRSGAQRAFGWEEEPEEQIQTTSSSPDRNIGVGGPAPTRSIPNLGKRSPVVVDGRTGAVEPSGAFGPSSGGGPGGAPVSAGAFTQQAQQEPVQDLGALYRQRIGGIARPNDQLTPEQQQNLRLNFFMRMLANNKPGSRFLQTGGQSGLETSKEAEELRAKNLARGVQQQQFGREDIFRELGLSDKSQDNRERNRHQKAIEEIQNKLADGRITAAEAQAQAAMLRAEASQLRAERAANDPIGTAFRTIMAIGQTHPEMKITPQQALQYALTKGHDREGLADERAFNAANQERLKQGMPALSRKAMQFQQEHGSDISRKSAIYKRFLDDPSIKGDAKKADAILQNELGVRLKD